MARINFEDSLWSDPRFMRLCIKLGDERTAIGAVTLAWKLAQKHWCPDKKSIPFQEWVESRVGREIIDAGLAREREDGIYVCGSEEHFAWWFERQAAGKRSALARKAKYGSADPRAENRENVNKTGTGGEHPFTNLGTSSSYSYSSSSFLRAEREDPCFLPKTKTKNPRFAREGVSPKPLPADTVVSVFENQEITRPKRVRQPAKTNPDGERLFVGEYVRAYYARWKTRPPLDGKTLGEIRRLVRDFGVERASALMQAYLQLDDPRFVKECHPFNLLMFNLSRLSVALDRGIEKPHEEDSWEKFWAKVDKQGGCDDQGSIQGAVTAITKPVG